MDPTIAFIGSRDPGAIEIVVNFGPLTGREATQAEVDRLARRLLGIAEDVRVHAVRTHDVSETSESIVHRVVVEPAARTADAEALRSVCETWAVECAEERSLDPVSP